MRYDEFDYKVREAEYQRADTIELSYTNNGYQWITIQLPRRHVEEVANALLRTVSE